MMAGVKFDDLVPQNAPAAQQDGAVAFDDLVPQQPQQAEGVSFDDLVPRRQAELRAYQPSWRDQIGGLIAGDSRPHEIRGRVAKMLVGSTGIGTENISMGDLFPPTGVAFAGNEAQRAAEQGNLGQAALHAVGVIPAPGVGPAARAVARTVQEAAPSVAEAAERLGVRATRAVDSGAADVVKELPTLLQNPVRQAAGRELDDLAGATSRTLEGSSGTYKPADAARRALDDWLLGRTRADTAADELAALRAAETPKAAPGPATGRETQAIVTPDQSMTVNARQELVELSDLQLASGRFQPRDRARAEYQQEALERANRLDPEQLRPGRVSDSGAPIVLDDGTIISGNGRAMSIAEVYTNPALAERAQSYRTMLGPEAANMRQPVLVMRAEAMTPENSTRFADLSNRGRIASMSATERAARDANAMGSEGIALYQGGDFTAPQNQAFLRHFAERVVAPTERTAFSRGAELSQEGTSRMRAAVLHGAYEDSAMLSRMLESTDDNIRNLTGALQDAASGFAALRSEIRAGQVLGDLDPSSPLTDAVRLIGDLRTRNVSPSTYFAQQDAFASADPLVEAWVRSFYNDELTRPVSRQRMAEVLNAYTTEARKHAPGGLFEDTTKAGDVLNVASRKASSQQQVVGDLPEAMGQGVRDSGPQARGPEALEVGAGPSASGAGRQGNAGPAAAGDAGQGQVGERVLSRAASEQAVTSNLLEARKASLAKALSEPIGAMTPERVSGRLMEMARSKLPADVSGLVRARQLVGDDTWRDLSTGILHRMGASGEAWDLVKFAQAYKDMTKSGRDVLFSGAGRDQFRQALDDLALLAERVPRLQSLTQSSVLPEFLDRMLQSKGVHALQFVLHPLTHFKLAAPQLTGWAVAKFISRPVVAKTTSRWARAMAGFSEKQTPATVAMLRLATDQLIDVAESD